MGEEQLKELLYRSDADVVVFNLGKGWQVHVWRSGEVYLQGLKSEGEKHFVTFKRIEVNLSIGKQQFLQRMEEIVSSQQFDWSEL